MGLLGVWLLRALALIIVGAVMPGFHVSNYLAALVAVAILALLNVTVKPVLLILSLPVTILTLGLFTAVINAVVFLLAGSIVDGLTIDSFWSALLGSLLFSLVSSLLESILRK